jgi:hypothetical protein
VSAGRYAATAAAEITSTSSAFFGDGLDPNSFVEITATLSTNGTGGFVFDRSGANRYKFVALDVAKQQVQIGHVAGGNWVVDAYVSKALAPNTDYSVVITIKGTSVSVSVGGSFAVSFGFNAPVADGTLGVLTRSGTTSIDSYRMKTNDAGFAGTPWVSAGDATVIEGSAGSVTATVTLTLSKAATMATSVAWTTVNGTGLAGVDYVAASGIATFAAGATKAQISLSVLGDALVEADETFWVALLGPSGLNIGRDAAAVAIVNDDRSVSIGNATVTETNTSTTVTVTVTLSLAAESTITVQYATANGTAVAGSDYTATSGTLTFSAGQTSKTIVITILGNKTRESTESFKVNLSNTVGAAIGNGTGTVTIYDDDGALTAASAPSGSASAPLLTQSALDPVVESAKAAWLSADPDANLSGVTVSIGDLPELQLGFTEGLAITIDATAAGWGWGSVDLYSVVLHELGHALGLDHEEDGVMAAELAAGDTLLLTPGARSVEPARTVELEVRTEVRFVRAPLPSRIEGSSPTRLIKAPAASLLRPSRAKMVRAGTARRLR